jgi:hypothetical protein
MTLEVTNRTGAHRRIPCSNDGDVVCEIGRFSLYGGSSGHAAVTAAVNSRRESSGSTAITSAPGRSSIRASVISTGSSDARTSGALNPIPFGGR